jgi:hypothetical protein
MYTVGASVKERASGWLPDMKVWKMGHRRSDPSNLCTSVVEARLVSY